MRSEIKSIQNAIGITSIYVTHDQTEALVMSDRVIVMNKGKVVQNDRPVEIYERPRSMFVAGFVGDANFLEGKVSNLDSTEGQISTKNGRKVFFIHHGESIQIGSQVTLCIRPERIRISREKTQEKNSYALRIEQVAFMGSISRYFLKSEDEPMVVDIPILTAESQFKIGDTIFAEWAPKDTRMVVEDQK
jgi:ABC-type Fe3+/spermidine/putrescine transport system ATPase subunit